MKKQKTTKKKTIRSKIFNSKPKFENFKTRLKTDAFLFSAFSMCPNCTLA